MNRSSFLDCSFSRHLRTLVLVCVFLFAGFDVVRSQSSPCAGTPPPPDSSHPIFKAGANVFVIYDSSLSQAEISQARAGFDSWNTANNQNGSGVHFQVQNANADSSIVISNVRI